MCWSDVNVVLGFKRAHIIIIINNNQKGKLSTEIPTVLCQFATINKISLSVSKQYSGGSPVSKALEQ